jgi:hypothetical protein
LQIVHYPEKSQDEFHSQSDIAAPSTIRERELGAWRTADHEVGPRDIGQVDVEDVLSDYGRSRVVQSVGFER